MKKLFILLIVVFQISVQTLYSQHTPREINRAKWISNHIINLDNLLGKNGTQDVEDGKPFSTTPEAIANARVVAFGEATHGGGTTYVIRDVLTNLMVASGMVSTLALEGLGLFDPPSTLVASETAWMWTGSRQAKPGLLRFLQKSKTDDFAISGVDIQHSSVDSLFSMTEQSIVEAGILDKRWGYVSEILKFKFQNPFKPLPEDSMKMAFSAVDDYISQLKKAGKKKAALFLQNAKVNALVPFKRSMKPRDLQMATNLLYLVEKNQSGKQIVLWGHNAHVAQSLSIITNLAPDWSYDNAVSMGEVLSKKLEDDYYVIAFTACGGSYGAQHLNIEHQEIKQPKAGSLEALVCHADFDTAAFLNLKLLSQTEYGRWLNNKLLARPLGYEFMKASWPLVFDGLLVVREMKPSIPLR